MGLLLFIVALLAAPLGAAERQSQLPLFRGGLHTRSASNAIPDDALSSARNVLLDEDADGVVVARKGRSKHNSTAIEGSKSIRGLWSFDAPDGTKYQITLSSHSMFYTSGNGVYTKIESSTMSKTAVMDCTTALGRIWCTNGTDILWTWNGTSTQPYNTAPLADLIDNHRNRIILAGIAGSKSAIYLSGELDGSDYTTNTLSTSPAIIYVGGVNDGDKVTCLMGVYQDVLIIGKRNSLWGLYGFGIDDFSLRELSREVGCIDDRNVKEKNGCLYWLSQRGVEKFCGTNVVRVSDPIRDNIKIVIESAGNIRSAIDTTQVDFEAGNLSVSGPGAPVSATLSPWSVVPSTWSGVHTGTQTWAAGTLSNTTFYADIASIRLAPSTTNTFFLDSFADGDSTKDPVWTELDPQLNVAAGAALCGAHLLNRGTGGATYAADSNGLILDSSSATWAAAGMWQTRGLVRTGSGVSGQQAIRFKFIHDSSTGEGYAAYLTQNAFELVSVNSDGNDTRISSTTVFPALGGYDSALTLTVTRDTNGYTTAQHYNDYYASTKTITGLDRSYWPENPTVVLSMQSNDSGLIGICSVNSAGYISQGIYFSSPSFNTGFSTPTMGNLQITTPTLPTGTSFVFQTRSSPDNTTWGAWTDATNGQKSLEQSQYIQYLASFTTTIATVTPSFTQVDLAAKTTGYFISQCRATSSDISAWDRFQCNTVPNGGDFTFHIATGTTCNMVTRTTATWQTQSNFTPISVPTAAYVAYRALFDIDHGTENPILRDCTISWNEGADRPPTTSAVYRDRYYLGYTSGTASTDTNDHILVLDKQDRWTLFDNQPCYSLNLYERRLYCGDSTATGYIYEMDSGSTDDGDPITSRIVTKAYDFGFPEANKIFNDLHLDFGPADDSAGASTMSVYYRLDRSSHAYSLGSLNLFDDPGHMPSSGFPFPLDQTIHGRYLQIQVESSGPQQWKMFGGKLFFDLLRR